MKREYIAPRMSAVEINVKGILMASGDNLMESVFIDDPQTPDAALAPLLHLSM